MFTMIFNLTRKGRGFMTSMNDLLLPYKQTDNQSNLFHHSLDKYQNHHACDNGRDTDWANHQKNRGVLYATYSGYSWESTAKTSREQVRYSHY
jgi:hypothetical protein